MQSIWLPIAQWFHGNIFSTQYETTEQLDHWQWGRGAGVIQSMPDANFIYTEKRSV